MYFNCTLLIAGVFMNNNQLINTFKLLILTIAVSCILNTALYAQSGYVQKSGGYGLPTYNNNATYNILCNWDGVWSTKWGNIQFTQTGPSTVEGYYSYQKGKIKGTIAGNKLSGYWAQSPTYAPLNDSGQCVFTISPNCNSFTGSWRYGFDKDNQNWNNDWGGKKIK